MAVRTKKADTAVPVLDEPRQMNDVDVKGVGARSQVKLDL